MAIYFDDETAVFVSIQMYGFIFVFPKGECTEGFYISSSRKTNPLSEAFTFEYFMKLYSGKQKKLSAKAFLATEQRIPGLGNGEPCMKCGHEIRKANYMGGTVYFCEHCQRK